MEFTPEIIRSNRKTVSVEIKRDLRVIVRAPMKMRTADIEKFVKDKTPWIEKHLEIMKARVETSDNESEAPFTDDEIRELAEKALRVIPPTVDAFAQMLGVSYGKITVRNQRTLWGSCSAKGNLNFNCLLMLTPETVIEYVIIHELCHRRYMDHSKDFWAMVEKYCPDYKSQRKWLKENGNSLIRRLSENG